MRNELYAFSRKTGETSFILVLIVAFLSSIACLGFLPQAYADSSYLQPIGQGLVVRGGDTQVAMIEEEVTITGPGKDTPSGPEFGNAHFTCTFHLKNTGDAMETLQAGFPVQDIVPQQFNGETAFHPTEPLEDLQVLLDGQEIQPTQAREPARTEGSSEGVLWATWPMAFSPGQEQSVEIRYTCSFAHEGAGFVYILTTGATWKGPIGFGRITFDWDGLISPEQVQASIEPTRSQYSPKGSTLVWEFRDWEPDRDLSVGFILPSLIRPLLDRLALADRAPSEVERHRQRALAYDEGGLRTDKGLQEARTTLAMEPENAQNYFLLSFALGEADRSGSTGPRTGPDLRAALSACEEGLKREPNARNGQFLQYILLCRLGWEEARNGNLDQACSLWRRALQTSAIEQSLTACQLLADLFIVIAPGLDQSSQARFFPQRLASEYQELQRFTMTLFLRPDGSGIRHLEQVDGLPLVKARDAVSPPIPGLSTKPGLFALQLPPATPTALMTLDYSFRDPLDLAQIASDSMSEKLPANSREFAVLTADLLKAGSALQPQGSGWQWRLAFPPSTYNQLIWERLSPLETFFSRDLRLRTSSGQEVPVPQEIKDLATRELRAWRQRLAALDAQQNVTYRLLFDDNGDGQPELEREWTFSLKQGLSEQLVDLASWTDQGGGWAALAFVSGALSTLWIGLRRIPFRVKTSAGLALLASLVVAVVLLLRAAPLGGLDGLWIAIGFVVGVVVAFLARALFKKTKTST